MFVLQNSTGVQEGKVRLKRKYSGRKSYIYMIFILNILILILVKNSE